MAQKHFQIDYDDQIDAETMEMALEYCDYDGNNQLDMCEVNECITHAENEFRNENCPEAGNITCPCNLTCEGEWTCEDIHYISIEVI